MSRLWIRADGSHRRGYGHIMRTVALAELAAQRGYDVRYVCHEDPTALAMLRGWDLDVHVLTEPHLTHWCTSLRSGDAVVFDGYHLDHVQHEAAAAKGARVCAVDDLGHGTFLVDVLVNQNPVIEPRYRTRADTVRLLGPRYAMVRNEFTSLRRFRPGSQRLLVTFGASDAAGMTLPVVEALGATTAFDEVVVLMGPGVQDDVRRGLAGRCTIITEARVSAAFDGVNAAISAAGSTTWELLCMGVPGAFLQIADNQRHIGERVQDFGAGLFLGQRDDGLTRLSESVLRLARPEEQERISRRAMELVDGQGAERILTALSAP